MRSLTLGDSLTVTLPWRVMACCVAACGALAFAVGAPAFAVDGYKNYEFGMSPEKVKRACPVPLQDASNEGWADAFGRDCRVLVAGNFSFMGSDREVNFVFTKQRELIAVAFLLEPDEFPTVAKALGEKYPDARLQPNPVEFQAIAARFDAGQPNSVVKITYDEDTVVLVGVRDEAGNATFVVMYRDADAEPAEISQAAKDDL